MRPRSAARARRSGRRAAARLRRGLLELIGDQAVRPPQEGLGRSVELLAEPARRLLADRAHPVLELERPGFREAVDLARGRALELRDLARLELRERHLDPRPRLALCALDLLADGVLVLAQPLGDVLDRPAPVVRLQLQLLEGFGKRVPGRPLELLTEADCCRALLVDRRSELVGLRHDARLDLGDLLSLKLLELGDLALERALSSLEIRLPSAQALLRAPLDGGDHLGQALRELPLADAELATTLIRQPPLLGHVRRHRVGMGARDGRPAELGLRRGLRPPPQPRTAFRASATRSSVRAARVAQARSAAPGDSAACHDERREEAPERGSTAITGTRFIS